MNENEIILECDTEVRQNIKQSNGIKKYFKFIIDMIIKPMSTSENNEKTQDNLKLSLILTGVISLIMALLNVYTTIFTKVKTSSWRGEVKWVWENFNFFDAFIKPLFITAIIIAAIAFLYYIIGLILKKDIPFERFLTYSAISFIPYTLASVLSQIISNFQVNMIIMGLAFAYLFIYTMMLSIKEFKLEDNDKKFYVYLIVISIFILTIVFSFLAMINSTVTSIFGSINF